MQTIGPQDKQADAGSGISIAQLRDDFYRDGFRVVMLSMGTVIVAIGLLIVVSLYFFFHQVLPITFPVYEDWRVQADIPLNRPYLQLADMLQWVSMALPTALTIDFINYDQNIKEANPYFTPNGWTKYLEIMNTYMGHDAVVKDKEFVKSKPAGAPVVLNQGLVEGKYGWWVQMPMDVLYSGIEGNNKNLRLIAQVLVVRIPTLNNLNGVAIDNMIIKSSL